MSAMLVGATLAAVGPAAPVSAQGAAQQRGSIRVAVTDGVGPVPGVAVDLFTADEDGNRAAWLDSVATYDTGFTFVVDPGCYIVTFIAPSGRTFVNGSRWVDVGACVDAGEERSGIDAALEPAVPGNVVGSVTDETGAAMDGVTVDLFTARADGGRGGYLRSATTGADGEPGRFAFTLSIGCYVLTYVADSRHVVRESGTPWFNQPFCVTSGEVLGGFSAVLERAAGTIVAKVAHNQQWLEDVEVDLFVADGAGGRAAFVTSTRTDAAGVARFSPEPGCYILTFVAPTGYRWRATATLWLNRPVCVAAGTTAHPETVELGGRVFPAVISVTVVREGTDVPGVVIDLFEAGPDGSRGRFVDGTVSLPHPTSLPMESGSGCWVVTLTAPDDDTFTESGTRWLNRAFCTDPSETVYRFIEQLDDPRPDRVEILDLDEAPHRISGQVGPGAAVDHRVIGEPGRRVSLEVLTTGPRTCDVSLRLSLVVKTSTELIRVVQPTMCGPVGPWTIPADGELTLGFRSNYGNTITYDVLVAEVDYEEVELNLSPGSSETLSGTITLPYNGVDYVVKGQPGQAITVALTGPTCEPLNGNSLTAQVLTTGGDRLGLGTLWCGTYGPYEIPDDGVLLVRMLHNSGPIVDRPEAQSYVVSISMNL